MNPINNINFQEKIIFKIESILALLGFDNNDTAPSTIPAGQIYLQNAGSGMFAYIYITGRMITNTTRITYFKYENALVKLLFQILGV